MTTPTWIALDDYLVAQFEEQMGPSSPYTTLRLHKVVAIMLRDKAKQWEAWATANELPALAVEGNDVGYGPGEFGGVRVMVAQEFAYTAVPIIRADTDVLAMRQIKEMADRTVQALTKMRVGINLEGPHPLSAIPSVKDVRTLIYPAKGELNQWFGLGLVDFTVGKRRG